MPIQSTSLAGESPHSPWSEDIASTEPRWRSLRSLLREPLVQSNPVAANVFICMSFFVALFNYVRFAREVIWQMCVSPLSVRMRLLIRSCEYTGIACFTVRRRDAEGHWVESEQVQAAKSQ